MYQNIYVNRRKKEVIIWDDIKGKLTLPIYGRSATDYGFAYGYKKSSSGKYHDIYGNKFNKFKLAGRLSEEDRYSTNFAETDVPHDTRALIDLYYGSDEMSTGHRTLFFDIETEILQGFPDSNNPVNKITAISYYIDCIDQYVALILDEDGKVPKSNKDNVTIKSYTTEFELLSDFLKQYLEIKPTILTGWNIDFFDIPYLYNRINRVFESRGIENAGALLSWDPDIRDVHENENFAPGTYTIGGVSVLDYLPLYKNFTMGERSSYRLDAIGKVEVDMGKIEYDGTLDDLYEQDINKFIEYNLNDVIIVKKIDDKLKYIDLARAICHKGHVPYNSIYVTSRYLEGAILTYTKRLGIVTKNKPRRIKKENKFTGAYVKSPVPGRYEWVYDLDLTSLYPSIIMTLNISPEKKIGKVVNWEWDEFHEGKDKHYTLDIDSKEIGYTTGDLKEHIKNNKYSVSANGVLYDTQKIGLMPSILNTWFNERVEFKNLMKRYAKEGNEEKRLYYHQRQYTTKILLNSLYGVLGLASFRFFDIDNAEAVTTTGRRLIQNTAKMINHYYASELGVDKEYCIYIDTDSCFTLAEPMIKKRFPNIDFTDQELISQKTLELAAEVQGHINTSYNLYAKRFHFVDSHRFEIKQEYVARAGFWVAKKRYAQWIINNEGAPVDRLDVKGLDVVRSNFPRAFRDFMSGILEDILKGETKEYIDTKILDFKEEIRHLPLTLIGKPTGVKKIKKFLDTNTDSNIDIAIKGTPVHVKSAMAYNNFLRLKNLTRDYSPIREGDKIMWLYLKDNKYKYETIAFKGDEDPDQIMDFLTKYIDYEKTFNSNLENKLQDFYQALQWGKIPENALINEFFNFS